MEQKRSLEEIYEDFRLYHQKLERDRKQHRTELIGKLRQQHRDEDFIPELEWSRDQHLEPIAFDAWRKWWSTLPEQEQRYLENEYRTYRQDLTQSQN